MTTRLLNCTFVELIRIGIVAISMQISPFARLGAFTVTITAVLKSASKGTRSLGELRDHLNWSGAVFICLWSERDKMELKEINLITDTVVNHEFASLNNDWMD